MNLKIEDLEKEMGNKKIGDSGADGDSSRYSVSSSSFVHASMKEALANISNSENKHQSIIAKDKNPN